MSAHEVYESFVCYFSILFVILFLLFIVMYFFFFDPVLTGCQGLSTPINPVLTTSYLCYVREGATPFFPWKVLLLNLLNKSGVNFDCQCFQEKSIPTQRTCLHVAAFRFAEAIKRGIAESMIGPITWPNPIFSDFPKRAGSEPDPDPEDRLGTSLQNIPQIK